MIQLESIIASGGERDVYRHPSAAQRVIKIARDSALVDRNSLEYEYYQTRQLSSFTAIPRLWGWVETSHGRGLECDLVADENGGLGLTLTAAVATGRISPSLATLLLSDFFRAARWAGVAVFDIKLENFLYQPESVRVFLVDGFGPRDPRLKNRILANFGFLARLVTLWTQQRTMRHWRRWLDASRSADAAPTALPGAG
jgi:hypothetical protein